MNDLVPVERRGDPVPTHTPEQIIVRTQTSVKWFVRFGFLILTLFVGGSAYWAMTAKLDGAVFAQASFVVEGQKKTVQHLDGGIVSEILVKEGDFVEADQILLRMDSTDTDVNLDVFGGQFADLSVRRARLLAELGDKAHFSLADLGTKVTDTANPQTLNLSFHTQNQLFVTRRNARKSEERILEQRIGSLVQQIDGLEEQRESNARQVDIAKKELATFQKLLKKQLVPASRVAALEREIERLRGLDAAFRTDQARAHNEIGELRLTGESQKKLRQEAITAELSVVETQLGSIEPQYFGALLRGERVEIKAPATGRVVNLSIYTKGGVILPGAPIMDIVPLDKDLIVEARVETGDIEKLYIGQKTRVRLTAFDQADVPEAQGTIVDLSADSIEDDQTGAEYFVARVKLDDEQTASVASLDLVPGMPADLFINTGERTAISYLMQPLSDRIVQTFIE
ncbi:MAG: HlyD family type I secretion periplasmic adaptor subunit [Pseudomonadota bacterium]